MLQHFPHRVALTLALTTSLGASAQTLEEGLRFHARFAGNLEDATGNVANGTGSGTSYTSDANGNAMQALFLEADENDVATFPDADALQPTTAITLALWVRVDDTTGISGMRCTVLSKRGISYPVTYELGYLRSGPDAGKWYFTPRTITLSSDGTYPLGTWCHLTATFDGSTSRFYINGVQQAATTSGQWLYYLPGLDPLMIGRSAADGVDWPSTLYGAVDDMRIYDRALDAEEITELYALDPALAIEDGTGARMLEVFPMPAEGVLHLSYPPDMGRARIVLTDASGRTVRSTGLAPVLDVSALSRGTYVLTVFAEDRLIGRRTLVLR